MNARQITQELRQHAPYTAMGTLLGVVLMGLFAFASVPSGIIQRTFWTFHPLHVLLSAMVTAAMYHRNSMRLNWLKVLLVGYIGSVGIATVSDSLIPFLGEWMLDLPNRSVHLGFIERWFPVNSLALSGILIGVFWPRTRTPHAMHVLISILASLMHIMMAMGSHTALTKWPLIALFLFLAVWIPCCTSDIVFPLLFAKAKSGIESEIHPSQSIERGQS